MLHLIWYIIVGLIAGYIAKSAMHVHLTLLWTIGLGSHLFSRPKEGASFHPAGLIFSILGALLVLFLWTKLNLHPPAR